MVTSFSNNALSDFDGATQKLILASKTLFGTDDALSSIVEPKKVGDKYYLPEDVEAGNNTCSYYLYTTAMENVAIFTNIEKWIALDNSLTADLKKFDDAKKPIADNIATLQAGIADKQDAIWKAELEVKLLDYTQNMSNGNPYSVSNSSACQIQALNSLMTTIKNAINNGGQVTYVTYDPVNHSFETVKGTIEKLISDTKETYYEALQASSCNWHEGTNDYAPFVTYMLGVLAAAYRDFESRIELLTTKGLSKPDRVREIIKSHLGKITKSEIIAKCPDISQITVQRALAELLKSGEITKLSGGRYTAYVWSGEEML